MAELLFNLIQSTKPCPDCVQASNAGSKTLEGWEVSQFGVPGSSGRVCNGNCHCLLIPEDMELEQLPDFGTDLLRGDLGSDLGKITDDWPLEIRFEELSAQWRAKFGDMPGRFLKMDLDTLIKTLESELGIR